MRLLDWALRGRSPGLPAGPPPLIPPGVALGRAAAGQVNTSRRRPEPVHSGIALNVAGTEWIIIVFAVLVLVLGTNKLPEAAKKFGRAVNEYNKAKEGVKSQVRSMTEQPDGGGVRVGGPVQTEREKLEAICSSLGIAHAGMTDAELRRLVAKRMGAEQDSDDAGGDAGAGRP